MSDDLQLTRFRYLYKKQQLGNLHPDGAITQQEKAELSTLLVTYRFITTDGQPLQDQIDQIKKQANQEAAEARKTQERREDSAKDVLHETVNKLAFDKEKSQI